MKIFRIQYKQNVAINLIQAWQFFSSPANLKLLTPPELDMCVSSGAEESMYRGQIITYTIKPLAGVKLDWVTEITHVNAPYEFIDEQRFGPYLFWHHLHRFKEIQGGVEVEDLVHYALPLGILGEIIQSAIVCSKLKNIFIYRAKVLTEKFGTINER